MDSEEDNERGRLHVTEATGGDEARAIVNKQVAACDRVVLIEIFMIPILFAYGYYISGTDSDFVARDIIPIGLEICTLLLSMKLQWDIYKEMEAWSKRDDVHPKARIAFEEMKKPYKLCLCGLTLPISKVMGSSLQSITLFWASIATAQVAGQSFDMWTEDVKSNCKSFLNENDLGGIADHCDKPLIPVMLTFFAAISYVYLCTFVPCFFGRARERNTPQNDQCVNFAVHRETNENGWYGWAWFRAGAEGANLALITEVCSHIQDEAARTSDKENLGPKWSAHNDRFGCNMKLALVSGPNLVLKCALLHLTVRADGSHPIDILLPIFNSFASKGMFIPKLFKDVTTRKDKWKRTFGIVLVLVAAWYALAVYLAVKALWGRNVVFGLLGMTLVIPFCSA